MPATFRLAVVSAAFFLAAPIAAEAHAEAGTLVENAELRTITGGKERLLSGKVKANILVFFRTDQGRSEDALKMLAACEKELSAKPVRWVGVVSFTEVIEDVKAMVARSGIAMPVVIDEDDALYGALGIRLHPMVAIIDGKFRLTTVEMYRQIDYCEVVKARIRVLLGELDQAGMEKVLNPPRSTMPNDDPRDVARRDVNLGRRQLKIKQYEKAVASANKAIGRAPIASAYSLLGDVAQAQGRCAEAIKQYQAALRIDPADTHGLAGMKACQGK